MIYVWSFRFLWSNFLSLMSNLYDTKLNCLNLKRMKEKAMAPHSNTLAWKIPWTEEPGKLQFMGSLRIGHDWATSLSLFTFMHWRRKWQPTPVFLLGDSQGRGAWSAAVYGVAQSRTRLKQLSSSSSNEDEEFIQWLKKMGVGLRIILTVGLGPSRQLLLWSSHSLPLPLLFLNCFLKDFRVSTGEGCTCGDALLSLT